MLAMRKWRERLYSRVSGSPDHHSDQLEIVDFFVDYARLVAFICTHEVNAPPVDPENLHVLRSRHTTHDHLAVRGARVGFGPDEEDVAVGDPDADHRVALRFEDVFRAESRIVGRDFPLGRVFIVVERLAIRRRRRSVAFRDALRIGWYGDPATAADFSGEELCVRRGRYRLGTDELVVQQLHCFANLLEVPSQERRFRLAENGRRLLAEGADEPVE